jgi:hypothetical protein
MEKTQNCLENPWSLLVVFGRELLKPLHEVLQLCIYWGSRLGALFIVVGVGFVIEP